MSFWTLIVGLDFWRLDLVFLFSLLNWVEAACLGIPKRLPVLILDPRCFSPRCSNFAYAGGKVWSSRLSIFWGYRHACWPPKFSLSLSLLFVLVMPLPREVSAKLSADFCQASLQFWRCSFQAREYALKWLEFFLSILPSFDCMTLEFLSLKCIFFSSSRRPLLSSISFWISLWVSASISAAWAVSCC